MVYKVLATDMDGTLLKNNKTISEKNLSSLKEARARGMEIIICTGRPFGTLRHYLLQLDYPCWVVTNNGAVVRNKNNDIVQVTNIKQASALQVIKILNEEGIYYHATDPHYAFINSYGERLKSLQKLIKKTKESLISSWIKSFWAVFFSNTHRKVNLLKYVEAGGTVSSIFVHSRDLQHLKKVRKRLVGLENIQITSSEKHNIEILDTYATKGLALQTIVEELGISSKEIIAVGDNHNDLSMIRYAGFGVAMANSEAEVLEVADYITKSNEEDGISYLLKKVFDESIENKTLVRD